MLSGTEGISDSKVGSSSRVDARFLRLMRKHQYDLAQRLTNRLLGIAEDGRASREEDDISKPKRSKRDECEIHTGAILADEVGTGKTLVSIGVIYSLCNHLHCKAIVVCPTTLVRNWENEIEKWMGVQHRHAALFIYCSKTASVSGGPDEAVHTFISSHASIRPVLVICYEMFRAFAAAFNSSQAIEILVCDEGHRLKNAVGTKTSLAISNCIATRRMIVTGTPIQNNLDELYAVVQFVVPGLLGSLKEFQQSFANAIIKGQAGDATPQERSAAADAASQLQQLLRNVLIHSAKEEITAFRSSTLPNRQEIFVHIRHSEPERQAYLQETNKLIQSLAQEEEMQTQRKRSITPAIAFRSVLPTLTKLRLSVSVGQRAESPETAASMSSKLEAVTNIIRTLREHCKEEKIIIVSNFTVCLNFVEACCQRNGYKLWRIDGDVPEQRRSLIVKHFNTPYSSSDLLSQRTVLLLSAKAGGVGLNLIGASRMIILEPDWNPATDKQAAGRIYREGQLRPVYIYRLVCAGTLEECIVRRQLLKNSLQSCLTSSDATVSSVDEDPEELCEEVSNITSLSELLRPIHQCQCLGVADEATRQPAATDDLILRTAVANLACCCISASSIKNS